MTSKKAKIFYGAFGARLRRGPSALAGWLSATIHQPCHQLLPVQLLPPGSAPLKSGNQPISCPVYEGVEDTRMFLRH